MSKLSVLAARTSLSLLSLAGRGGSMPGTIALKLDPDSLSKLKFNGPVILVTGTNGKTSTANMISSMFEKAGKRVVSNRKGDNMKAGITTAILSHAKMNGTVDADVCVLEVDELNIRHVLPYIPVSALVVTNFFRDQLDRAKEMEQLIQSIESVLPNYEGTLVLNGDDPNTVRLACKAPKAKAVYFGIEKNQYSVLNGKEAAEGKFCPICSSRLHYDYYQYSHIGHYSCPNCDFKTPEYDVALTDIDLTKQTFVLDQHQYQGPYEGMYSMYNYAAVAAVMKHFNVSNQAFEAMLSDAPKPAGRNEHFSKGDQQVILNLIKNPTGANEVLKVIEQDHNEKSIVIVLNDKEQDGTDISWIYDTQFEKLMNEGTKQIICTGRRAGDMALRLFYGDYQNELSIEDDVDQAVVKALSNSQNVYVIATYTALLVARKAIMKEMGL
ncbi:MAG: MurT ligase domain-containing protein [Erysipelotrichaceae bacterium]|nr:MurT ligase domain-containing protein [Erysipelotrichaceae bacterium]